MIEHQDKLYADNQPEESVFLNKKKSCNNARQLKKENLDFHKLRNSEDPVLIFGKWQHTQEDEEARK